MVYETTCVLQAIVANVVDLDPDYNLYASYTGPLNRICCQKVFQLSICIQEITKLTCVIRKLIYLTCFLL